MSHPYPDVIELGEHSYIGPGAKAHVSVEVGRYTSIAADLRVVSGAHPSALDSRVVSNYPFHEQFGSDYVKSKMNGLVQIGSDVWICENVTILEGLVIGHGAIVAAGSVVVHDVPPYAVVAGNPAVYKRQRFTDEQVDRLLEIAWWDWPREEVLAAVPAMRDIATFLR